MQLERAVLLEGPPGVGKSSLIAALAAVTGNVLVRINLSEQTDLVDLFGSDLPTDGGQIGAFSWCDGPFLRALKQGHWILLDELNLASQSVLEGLNACLDHRAAVYIPELDRTFSVSKSARIFAAQNPAVQGGGRKGLPKSFINRFACVWFESLGPSDYSIICKDKFPTLDAALIEGAVEFNQRLNALTAEGSLGLKGRPWEFNLRDLFRWFSLLAERGRSEPWDWMDLLYTHRFRTESDRVLVRKLALEVFGWTLHRAPFYTVDSEHVRIGRHSFKRSSVGMTALGPLQLLHSQVAELESLLTAIGQRDTRLVILTGDSGIGKSAIIRLAAGLLNRDERPRTVVMGPDTDALDLLGSFEQDSLTGKFVWRDGPLTTAVEEGHWLVLEHANTASASVLDRLNSLLEPEGELLLSEQGGSRTIRPHHLFKLFFTIDGRLGEVSRAMRNRSVELALLPQSDGSVLDTLAVVRAATRTRCNSMHSLSSLDYRTAVTQGLMAESSLSAQVFPDPAQWWSVCRLPLPMNVLDAPSDLVKHLCDIVTSLSSDCNEQLVAWHRAVGFDLDRVKLLADGGGPLQGLEVWKTAVHLLSPSLSSYQYPQDSEFVGAWRRDWRRLALPSRSQGVFECLLSVGCADPSAYKAAWLGSANVTIPSASASVSDAFDRLLNEVEEYLEIVDAGGAELGGRHSALFKALEAVGLGCLRELFIASLIFKRDIAEAAAMVSRRYVPLIVNRVVGLKLGCSLADYQKLLSTMARVEDLLSLDREEASEATRQAADLESMKVCVRRLLNTGDPSRHLIMQAKVLTAVAELQRQECILQERFLVGWKGYAEGWGSANCILQGIVADAEALNSDALPDRDASPLIALLEHAQPYLMTLSVGNESEQVLRTVVNIRQAVTQCGPSLFDLSYPIIVELDRFALSLLRSLPDLNRPRCQGLTPVQRLRQLAIKASELQAPLVPGCDLIRELVGLVSGAAEDGGFRFKGVEEDDKVEADIVTDYFTHSADGTQPDLPADNVSCVGRLLVACAMPLSATDRKRLLDEQSYSASVVSGDCSVNVRSIFSHLRSPAQGSVDFYKTPQPLALHDSLLALGKLGRKVGLLLVEWPEHDVLQSIASQIDRYQELRAEETPPAAAVVALERILQKAESDWQPYADTAHSLAGELEVLRTVIIDLRRRELDGWRSIAAAVEEREYSKPALGQWHLLSRMLLLSLAEPHELVKLLEEFLMAGRLGELGHRLSLLSAFALLATSTGTQRLVAAVVSYFTPILAHLDKQMVEHRSGLEQDLKAYLKTVHWSETTYFSLRQSLDRSHRKMAGFVRRLRELYDRPVSSLLASQQYVPSMSLLAEKAGDAGARVLHLDRLCQQMDDDCKALKESGSTQEKQRALIEWLSVMKESFALRMVARPSDAALDDPKQFLVRLAESDSNPAISVSCYQQYILLAQAGRTAPSPDLGLRAIECLQAASSQLVTWPLQVVDPFRALDRLEGLIKESSRAVPDHGSGDWLIVRRGDASSALASISGHGSFAAVAGALARGAACMVKGSEASLMGIAGHCSTPNAATAIQASLLLERMQSVVSWLSEEGDFSVSSFVGRWESFLAAIDVDYIQISSKKDRKALGVSLAALRKQVLAVTRAMHKFVFCALAISTLLLKEGFCLAKEQASEQGQEDPTGTREQEAGGQGMAEGEGQENINQELEFEEQLTGLKSDEKDKEDRAAEREEDELEMRNDFDADLEQLQLPDSSSSGTDDASDISDREGDPDDDGDGEQQEMDRAWSSEADSGDGIDADPRKKGKDDLAAMSSASEPDECKDQELSAVTEDEEMAAASSDHDTSIGSETDDDSDGGSVADDGQEHLEEEGVMADSESDGQESDTSTANPLENPDQEDQPQEQKSDVDPGIGEGQEARALDSSGALPIEEGVMDAEVMEDDTQTADKPAAPEQGDVATRRTIHRILEAKTAQSSQAQPSGQEPGASQLYEEAIQGERVRAPSSSSVPAPKHANDYKDNREASSARRKEQVPTPPTVSEASPLVPPISAGSPSQEDDTPAGVDSPSNATVEANANASLAMDLCEQLRLVLEPTTATRLRGDYRTGKRLNMRKIIPFIASGFRRDKIWLRRTKPAKRDYNIVLSIDRSRSMRECGADQLASSAVKIIALALERLEAGKLACLSFGSSVQVLKGFDSTSDAGKLLDGLVFQDESTDIALLLERQLELFPSASKDWQLNIILSDGICQDHSTIRSLVNWSLERRILPLLILIDPGSRILDLSHVEQDPATGKVKLKKYLEGFPFEHYMILKRVEQLPGILSEALRQWFEQLSSQ